MNPHVERYRYTTEDRKELEMGDAAWPYIRRRAGELADETQAPVLLFVFNPTMRRWEYLRKTLPGGESYDWNGNGPFVLRPDACGYILKEGGQA